MRQVMRQIGSFETRFLIINGRLTYSPWYSRLKLSVSTWSKHNRSDWKGHLKLVFPPSFRMKSGAEVKQQLTEEHYIFIYFPCSLRFLQTRKSAQLSCYSACDITGIFAIYWRTSTFFNHNSFSENTMSLLFSSAMLLNNMT